MKLRSLSLALPFALLLSTAHAGAPFQPSWQQRYAEFIRIVEGVRRGDAAALKRYDEVLADFNARRLERTPMEHMEILGAHYLPREGLEKTLPLIVANATLGWYDTLRFASEPGRGEISYVLFRLPFLLAGADAVDQAVSFFEAYPEQTETLVSQGIAMARQLRSQVRYEQRWPIAFGFNELNCAQGGECAPAITLPENRWETAWQQAEQQVRKSYRDDRQHASD
ncbi:hypothetical protein [Pseudoduganella violacea]|uniref:DUF4034 domain-containing protein n=1 Tax=Pseudoduganella violacea TaxID=1715466 RepID=A0A7W5BE15_9BURK|nr:hypothetical protein [Pseudoduganella violacea]MBB3121456.1 hypothetical protein [Pseudoduganella violacea]